MKHLLFTLIATLVLAVQSVCAASPAEKATHLYAVKGADSLYLDHYVSPVEGLRPCVIFVFGGGFSHGVRDKEGDIPYFEFLQSNGYDVVSIDYRLGMREAKDVGVLEFFPLFRNTINLAVEDLFSATSYILDNAEQWNIDPSQIIASGSSAGAITVLQGGYSICNHLPIADSLPEGFNYAGIISFAGAVFSLEGAPRWSADAAPTLLFHGNSDTQVPYNKMALFGRGMFGSKYIAGELRKAGAPYWFYSVEYQTHAMAWEPMHNNHAEILLFLDEFVVKGNRQQRDTHIRDLSLPERKTFFLPTDYLNSNY